MLTNCLHIISPHTVSRVTHTALRHLSDTFQTTFRHSEAPGKVGTSWSKLPELDWYQLISHHTPLPHPPHPRQYPKSLRQHQTPPIHLQDTLQTPQNRAFDGQSRVIERKGTNQLKQYSMFLQWIFVNWSGMITLQDVVRVTLTTSTHLPDTFQTPSRQPQLY